MNVLAEIQNWYHSQCNGYWEHEYGIKIDTLDNPGWHITVDLAGTNLETKEFQQIEIDKSNDDWFVCRVIDKKFDGHGDPQKLEKILQFFLEWTKN
jgi:Immunity protein 53